MLSLLQRSQLLKLCRLCLVWRRRARLQRTPGITCSRCGMLKALKALKPRRVAEMPNQPQVLWTNLIYGTLTYRKMMPVLPIIHGWELLASKSEVLINRVSLPSSCPSVDICGSSGSWE